MSYCVNCGVELDVSEKACPLCGVEVLNPRQPYDEKAIRPYPGRLDPINERINRHFTAAILSICLAFPAFFCLAVNLILDGEASWSLYVIGALALIWVAVVPFFLHSPLSFAKLFLPVVLVLLLYLLLIASLQADSGWYLPLALPLTLLTCGLILINGLLISFRIIHGFAVPASILISIALLMMGIEAIIELYLFGQFALNWSFFIVIPTVTLAAVFLTIARRQAIREEIHKRLHL